MIRQAHGRLWLSFQLLARLPHDAAGSVSRVSLTACQQRLGASSAAGLAPAPDAVQDAARELGLDALPLPQLKEMMAAALPEDGDEVGVALQPAKQRKLTFADIQGYEELLTSLIKLPATYAQDMPTAPALDAGQWVDAHFKEVGFGLEPRSPFYVWRSWAARTLPPEQYGTLLAMESVMADDTTRAAVLKQAQHELARLWDWQHRRAALGLDLDISCDSLPAPAPASSSGGSRQAPHTVEGAVAAAAARPAQAQPEAAAAADLDDSSGSSSSSDEDGKLAAAHDLSDKGMLEVLEVSGALASEEADEAAAAAAQGQSSSGPVASAHEVDEFDAVMKHGGVDQAGPVLQQQAFAAAFTFSADDVVDDAAAAAQAHAAREQRLAQKAELPNIRQLTLAVINAKLNSGRDSADKGRQRKVTEGFVLRKFSPVTDDDDLFLPTPPVGDQRVAAALADPNRTRPVSPDKVTQQAVALAEAAKRVAATAEWTSLPLLDRTVLHNESLRQAAERLAAKPKQQQPWQLLPLDDYTFDLQQRPPSPMFDLLTSYLEVKYADVLLRKDAVRTLQKQMALTSLTAADGGSAATEVLEAPPAALTAPKTLSAVERAALVDTLDLLLGGKQYRQYREAVLKLYCDGLVTWGELQQCWAAAEAGEELEAAAAAPVTFADDRQKLFSILSGQQQLGDLLLAATDGGSSSSGVAAAGLPAEVAAAKKLWQEAGLKLKSNWAPAAAAAAAGDSGRDWWQQQISYEEAERMWQQLLKLTGHSSAGPSFHKVLLAGSDSSSGEEEVQQQLQQLQRALQTITGVSAPQLDSNDSAVAVDDFKQLQQLFAAPPSLEQLLQQHWEQVSQQELQQNVSWKGPSWQQLWQLLQRLAQQHTGAAAAAAVQPVAAAEQQTAAAAADVPALFQRFLAEADAVPLTPPPYPGARKVLRWEQRLMLHATSGSTVLPAELKVKLSVSAHELQQETGLSRAGLQHLLAIAGNRYNPRTGLLSLSCDRFSTREENRRWCLEVLHRLLQEAHRQYPSSEFLLSKQQMQAIAGPAAAAAVGVETC